jgi:hypothetical protein
MARRLARSAHTDSVLEERALRSLQGRELHAICLRRLFAEHAPMLPAGLGGRSRRLISHEAYSTPVRAKRDRVSSVSFPTSVLAG